MDDATLERLLANATPGPKDVLHRGTAKDIRNSRDHFRVVRVSDRDDADAIGVHFHRTFMGNAGADAHLYAIAPDLAAEVLRLRASEKRKCADCMGLFNELAAEAEANAAEIARLRAVEKAAKDMAVAVAYLCGENDDHIRIAIAGNPSAIEDVLIAARAALSAFNATQEGV